jgi:hypothetical protein
MADRRWLDALWKGQIGAGISQMGVEFVVRDYARL